MSKSGKNAYFGVQFKIFPGEGPGPSTFAQAGKKSCGELCIPSELLPQTLIIGLCKDKFYKK